MNVFIFPNGSSLQLIYESEGAKVEVAEQLPVFSPQGLFV